MLWQLEHENFPAVSYLFGTMHVQDGRAFGKLGLVKEKIRACDQFAVEFDLNDRHISGSMSNTFLPNGQRLEDLISPRKFAKLRKILRKSIGLDIAHFQRMLPFMVLGLVSSSILRQDMPTSLDEELWAFAEGEGKTMHGIETLAEQMAVLAQISIPDQVKMLLSAGSNIRSYRRHLHHVTELYQQEDFQRLSKVTKRSAKGLRKLMLYRRNEVMADRIFRLASEASTFAGVGAGHLGGGKGVIRLLKKMGVVVRPV